MSHDNTTFRLSGCIHRLSPLSSYTETRNLFNWIKFWLKLLACIDFSPYKMLK
ncbi:Hypothetical protein LLKF_2253 [Lactococcus lactis subsp. lactis KF147]|nr:Hypothetical protein LLKF_2253 [Lactococcus lactis subsp. lactis KF147]